MRGPPFVFQVHAFRIASLSLFRSILTEQISSGGVDSERSTGLEWGTAVRGDFGVAFDGSVHRWLWQRRFRFSVRRGIPISHARTREQGRGRRGSIVYPRCHWIRRGFQDQSREVCDGAPADSDIERRRFRLSREKADRRGCQQSASDEQVARAPLLEGRQARGCCAGFIQARPPIGCSVHASGAERHSTFNPERLHEREQVEG